MIIVIHAAGLLSSLVVIYILDKKSELTNLIALSIFTINLVFISVVIA
jgi:hypothetical protein